MAAGQRNQIKKVWKEQERYTNGRFGKKRSIVPVVFTLEDIKQAFIAGHNATSRIFTPSELLQQYLKRNELK